MIVRRGCEFPYCPKQASRGAYCVDHARIQTNRLTRTALGYDNRWLRFRKVYLARHPLCVHCQERGDITPAHEIHHEKKLRDYPELQYEENNLTALCSSCHARVPKSAQTLRTKTHTFTKTHTPIIG
jgi:5-methylcytosine-specific restriction protein A